MKNKYKHYYRILFLCTLVFISLSCAKKTGDTLAPGDKSEIVLSVSARGYLEGGNIGPKANSATTVGHTPVRSKVYDIGNNLQLTAEITATNIEESNVAGQIVKKAGNKAVETVKNELTPGVWYKLVVYDNDNKFVKTLNYKYKSESLTEPLLLTVGEAYTFVAYSVNSTTETDLPSIRYADASSSGLESAYLKEPTSSHNGTLLFFKTTHVISATEKNYLNIIFNHKFNEIKTVIDITDTEYAFTGTKITAKLNGNSDQLRLSFATEEVSSVGDPSPNLTFSYNGTNTIATANTIYVNNNENNILTIESMSIGPLINYNINPFPNVQLVPGTKYNINLKITPSDELFTHKGQAAARINGQIWMRYNLGSDNNQPADVLTAAIQGDYYQWGKNEPYATGTSQVTYPTASNPFPKYDSNTQMNAQRISDWAAGTETNPKKGPLDPCPPDFRIPTASEFQQLIASTTYEYVGTPSEDQTILTNYSYGLRLTSQRKQSVILTFPAQGFSLGTGSDFIWIWGGFIRRGNMVTIKTVSNELINTIFKPYTVNATTGMPTIYMGVNITGNASYGHPIRCIATNNDTNGTRVEDRENESSSGNIIFN